MKNHAKLKITIILSLVVIFLLPQIVSAAVTLPWSTTFNCAEWTSPNIPATINCDGLGRGGDWVCTDGTGSHATQITSGANMAAGGGGRGFRNWYGPCKNNNSGGVDAGFARQKELWVRWYMRFPTTFGWSTNSGCAAPDIQPKLIYVDLGTSPSNEFQPYLYHWDSLRMSTYTYQVDAQGYNVDWLPQYSHPALPNTGVGWDTIMAAGPDDPANPGHKKGDGLWHYYEVHAKAPTTARPIGKVPIDSNTSDGILQMWIDGKLVMNFNNVWFLADNSGWANMLFNANYQGVSATNPCTEVDMDDIAISTTGYIGPLVTTPDTTPPAAPTGVTVS